MQTTEIQSIIKELLDTLTLEYESVEVKEDSMHEVFLIQTKDSQKLIGNRGENLRAFNYIAKRIAERKLGIERPTFLIDVNGYQEMRNDEIRKTAEILIGRVRSFKTEQEMNDLNSYERMLVHSMVSDDPEIETESFGTGKTKRLVIRYKEPSPDITDTL